MSQINSISSSSDDSAYQLILEEEKERLAKEANKTVQDSLSPNVSSKNIKTETASTDGGIEGISKKTDADILAGIPAWGPLLIPPRPLSSLSSTTGTTTDSKGVFQKVGSQMRNMVSFLNDPQSDPNEVAALALYVNNSPASTSTETSFKDDSTATTTDSSPDSTQLEQSLAQALVVQSQAQAALAKAQAALVAAQNDLNTAKQSESQLLGDVAAAELGVVAAAGELELLKVTHADPQAIQDAQQYLAANQAQLATAQSKLDHVLDQANAEVAAAQAGINNATNTLQYSNGTVIKLQTQITITVQQEAKMIALQTKAQQSQTEDELSILEETRTNSRMQANKDALNKAAEASIIAKKATQNSPVANPNSRAGLNVPQAVKLLNTLENYMEAQESMSHPRPDDTKSV